MPFVQVAITAMACQIEDFPAKVDVEGKEPRDFTRSCEGALHVRPGGNAIISADELEHIKKTRPQLAAAIHVIASDQQLTASSKAAEPATLPPAPPTPSTDENAGSGGGEAGESEESEARPGKGGKAKR